ncbi:hypothetical protein ACJ64_15425 [Bacillus safensis]|nr:hypothetical protein ACJ64_15425 [Bacillus safensis]
MQTQTHELNKDHTKKSKNFQGKTETIEFINTSTKYDVKIAFGQGFDEDGVEPGMAEKTGIVTIATELTPGKSTSVDVGRLNCRATRAECSLVWRYRETGYEGELNLVRKAPTGQYLQPITFGIQDPTSFIEHNNVPPAPVINLD